METKTSKPKALKKPSVSRAVKLLGSKTIEAKRNERGPC